MSIDNLIKRTRQQYARGRDKSRTPDSQIRNRERAEKNIAFLRSLGVRVEKDHEHPGKLVIERREIA